MPVTLDDVDKVASLSRLSFSDDERRRLVDDLNRILEYMDQLNELDTENVEPTAHVLLMSNVFREDAEKPSMPKEKLLANAPSQEKGYFKVPQVIE